MYVNDFSDAFEISLPLPTIRTASDSLAISESLSRSVSTWKVVESHTDSVSTTESFSTPSVTTYRTTVSTSNSVSLSESLARSLDTWEYIISHSDSVATAESLAKSTYTYRNVETESDSVNTSESLAKSTYVYRTPVSTSDSISSSESLARSLDAWRYILSNSDSISSSESLVKSTYVYRTPVSASDSVNTSESLLKAVETWRHILAYSMGMSLSESLSRTIYTYRTSVSSSDSISTSEGLALLVETWKYVESNSNSIVTAESLSRAVENWRQILTNSDSLATSDSLNVQIRVMDDAYFYDNAELKNASRISGYVENGSFVSSSGLVTSAGSLVDGQTSTSATFSGSDYAGVRFDLGSQTTINFICIYLNSGFSELIKFYGSNSQGSGWTLIATANNSSANWTINEFNECNYRYYCLQLEASTINSKIDEIIIGEKFVPEIRQDIGSGDKTINDKMTLVNSYAGDEYAFRTGKPGKLLEKRYSNISQTLKNNFADLYEKSSDKKFIYYYDGINYCSIDPVQINEIAVNRYSLDIKLKT